MKAGLGTPESKIWYKTEQIKIKNSDAIREQNVSTWVYKSPHCKYGGELRASRTATEKSRRQQTHIPGHLGIKRQCLISSTSCQAAAVKGRKEKKRKERKLQDELEVRNHTHTHTGEERAHAASTVEIRQKESRAAATVGWRVFIWIRRLITWRPGVAVKQLSPRW